MMLSFVSRPSATHIPSVLRLVRAKRYDAFDADLDPELLAEAREWRKGFGEDQLPDGATTFARSSGPGGQHVNKTETKALSVFRVHELAAVLPRFIRAGLRDSKYYVASNDSLSFQSQTSRSRSANQAENRSKLWQEVLRMYDAQVPAETSEAKRDKHRSVEQRFNENRIKDKKMQSSKKQSRRGPRE